MGGPTEAHIQKQLTTKHLKTNGTLVGLSPREVIRQRELNGSNTRVTARASFARLITSVVVQPMFILLLASCFTYFILGEWAETFTMLAALIFVAGIDVLQNYRSQRAVKALGRITAAKAKVIRSGETIELPSEELVTQDIIICEEGTIVPADAEIISSNDLSINEAILTGESASVERAQGDRIMQGTLIVRGYCCAKVQAVGAQTTLAGIGHLVETAGHEKTPLQKKVARFVRTMVVFGSIAFVFVWAYHWIESGSILHGLLHGLTMAMSVLPEEIPVALSTFMALGAYRLYKAGVIARTPQTVETLGSATVICVDKTGTLTQNLMQATYVYDSATGKETDLARPRAYNEVLEYSMWASEESPFDPMEKSIHELYEKHSPVDLRPEFHMIKEFPLSGSPPVMTHIFSNSIGNMKIACKGAVEGVLKLCSMSDEVKQAVIKKSKEYARRGYRVLGVAKGTWSEKQLPDTQEEISFQLLGLITFYDPPEKHIAEVIQEFYKAGLKVIMITGDYPETALAVAEQTGIMASRAITGQEIATLTGDQLKSTVATNHVFARISPEVKLRIINALKDNGEIVAMTGDGVNDAPALKAAHIGVAMGKRGTEVAKSAAGLVLSNDDLTKMAEAVYLGRRINENIRKAFKYIIAIHIPIILLVTVPIFLTWLPAMLFTPVHVIFLELVMGPTCSIVYENEHVPREELHRSRYSELSSLFGTREITFTIVQGLAITAGCLAAGYYTVDTDAATVRTMVFVTLVFSNVFLTLVNRSFSRSVFRSARIKNRLVPLIIIISLALLALIIFVPMLRNIFSVTVLSINELIAAVFFALVATGWAEIYKFVRERRN